MSNNIRSIIYVLWIVVSLIIGMSLGYMLALLGKPNELIVIFFTTGIMFSILISCLIGMFGQSYISEIIWWFQDKFDF